MGRKRTRRRGKEARERLVALLLLIPTAPLFVLCALLIKLEGVIDKDARGPVFFKEDRISRGRVIKLLKFRTLTAYALASFDEGAPTHIALLELQGRGMTRAGRLVRQWYLDELPQLLNIVKGDMYLIGTRPYPLDYYEQEMSQGITRKRDMPAGLLGLVQSYKGEPEFDRQVALDQQYWEAFQTYSAWKLLKLDLKILKDCIRVQARHQGL